MNEEQNLNKHKQKINIVFVLEEVEIGIMQLHVVIQLMNVNKQTHT